MQRRGHHRAEGVQPLTAEQGREDREQAGAVVQIVLVHHLVAREVAQQLGKLRVGLREWAGLAGEHLFVICPGGIRDRHDKAPPLWNGEFHNFTLPLGVRSKSRALRKKVRSDTVKKTHDPAGHGLGYGAIHFAGRNSRLRSTGPVTPGTCPLSVYCHMAKPPVRDGAAV